MPAAKHVIAEEVLARTPADERLELRQLFRQIALIFHTTHFETREKLRLHYEGFCPDRLDGKPPSGSNHDREQFQAQIEAVLEDANFSRMSPEEVELTRALPGNIRARVKVMPELYRSAQFFVRGGRRRKVRLPFLFGYFRHLSEAEVFDQVVFLGEVAPEAPEKELARADLVAGAIYVKLFRNIPRGDLTTLYPGARAEMNLVDGLLIGVPALIAGVPLVLKIIPSLSLLLFIASAYLGISGSVEGNLTKQAVAAAAALGGLIGFFARQWTSFDRTALRTQKELADQALYAKMIRNSGSLDFLVAAAEDEEVSEAFLAYAFAWECGGKTDIEMLDRIIEQWFSQTFGRSLDFEIEDAIAKLERLGIGQSSNGRLIVPAPKAALAKCRAAWETLSDSMLNRG